METQGQVYLTSYLAPLAPFLSRDDVTDIFINRPGELWLETLGGGMERHEAPELDNATLVRLARQIAALSSQGINREHPLLSASLPDGSRVQIIIPPATRGHLALAIRKHVSSDLALDDYVASGALENVRLGSERENDRNFVACLIEQDDIAGALREAVRRRLNILVSGGTSSGKTTFMSALMREIHAHERLVVIEDTPEIALHHENSVGLIATRGSSSESAATTGDLVSASLRMRPDRILLGELRGPEAFSFLRAINTGHPGSISTIHANDPQGAIEQLALLVLEGGSTLRRQDILRYVATTIGLIVQLERSDRGRRVSAILLPERLD